MMSHSLINNQTCPSLKHITEQHSDHMTSPPSKEPALQSHRRRGRAQIRSLLVCGGRGLGPIVARPRHLHEEFPQLCDVIIEGRQGWGRLLLALLDEIPETDAVHELIKKRRKLFRNDRTHGDEVIDDSFESKRRRFLTRTFPSEPSCFRGRSGSARVPSGKA